MKHKILRLMAYIYMPLIFTFFGYSLAYIALAPVLDMLQAVGNMVVAQEMPNFNNGLKSIYNPNAPKTISSTTSVEENVVLISDIQFPDYETQFGLLTCERIGLEAPVYWGDTNAVLKVGAGQFMGSFMPGFEKSILISAHNTTYFKPFQKMEVGDIITYDTNYGKFEYQVTELKVMHISEANAKRNELLTSSEEKLIMYTCYPFETLVGTKQDRLFAFANKISGPTIK